MSTKIEWADEVWNPVTGFSPVSEGCQGCYAKRMAKRLRGRYGYPETDPFRVILHLDRLDEPFKWKNPRRVFTVSMGDLFHDDVPFWFIQRVFNTIWMSPRHTFIILTKRSWRMYQFCSQFELRRMYGNEWPLPNLWLGVSVEDNRYIDRIDTLIYTPASAYIVSHEPALGKINYPRKFLALGKRGLVITGGESGPGARPMHVSWALNLKEQCESAGIPFFFKQMSGHGPAPEELMIREFPK